MLSYQLLLGDGQMSNEPEIGKEMSKEEKLAGISDTSQNKVQIELYLNWNNFQYFL